MLQPSKARSGFGNGDRTAAEPPLHDAKLSKFLIWVTVSMRKLSML